MIESILLVYYTSQCEILSSFCSRTECENLRAEVLSRGAAQLASAAQVRDLRRKIALLTSTNTKLSPSISNGDRDDITLVKPVKFRQVDDVKKKVSFN